MKSRKTVTQEAGDLESHEEVRELAEALSRFRSAMTYAAERASAQPQMAKVRPPAPSRFRLLLGPALGAAIAAGVLVPLYGHLHPRPAAEILRADNGGPPQISTQASIDDTALMNQIDSQLSENVPDALEPLADLSTQAAPSSTASEKNQ